jgi:hypothetical protein
MLLPVAGRKKEGKIQIYENCGLTFSRYEDISVPAL